MKTGTKSCGFAAFALALVALSGCGGGSSSSTTTTGGGGGTTSTNNQWIWVTGSNTALSVGNYGTQGTAAASNQPPARYGSSFWTDASGNFYLFGGQATQVNFLNDLWKYSPSSGQWTWLSGSNAANQTGVYGTLNTAATGNVPGGRYGSAYWKDGSGNLYVFGGVGVDKNGVQTSGPVFMNDLWKYSISSNQWTWIGGSNTGANASLAPSPAVYGTLGTAAAANLPGVRANATSITDSNGNFWLFGGQGGDSTGSFGNLNDLWKYSTSSGQWTWIAGSNVGGAAGVYGTQGTGATTNIPASRYNTGGWADSGGNIWLFGGSVGVTTSTSATFSPINDLWKFTPSNGQWTWVAGSNTAGAAGTYGTKGTGASGNTPGARAFPMTWVDSSNNLYLFGGAGVSGSSGIVFNDLWKYSPSSNQWTWLNGTSGAAGNGSYGTQGTSSAANVPGGRLQGASWSDTSGNLWLFGGQGFDATSNSANTLNDLWKYQP